MPYCDYNNQSFQITCNGESFISSQCFDKMFDGEMVALRPLIKHFKIVGCKRSILESEDILSYFDGLVDLDMSSLGYDTLMPETIPATKLLKLNLSHNSLSKIELKLFEQFPNMTEIDLSYNKISELVIFSAAPNLAMMNFSHNSVFFLHAGTFSQLHELKVLDLSFNKIAIVEKNTFIENQMLEILRLEMNPIYRFDENIFMPLMNSVAVSISCGNVKELDISYVGKALIVDLHGDDMISFRVSRTKALTCTKDEFNSMYHFNISGNQLRNTLNVIDFFESPIEIFDLSHNFLGYLSDANFNRFKKLRYLILSDTSLIAMAPDAFCQLNNLKVLDLSHNFLSTLDFGATVFGQVDTLRLEFNQLDEIEAVTPENFPSLTELSITNNKFTCFYLDEILSKWSNLNIVATCKGESHKIQQITEAFDSAPETTEDFDTVQGTTEAIDDISPTTETIEIEPDTSTQFDDDFQEITENFEESTEVFEYDGNLDDTQILLSETTPTVFIFTTELPESSKSEIFTEELSTEFEKLINNLNTEKTESPKEIASTDFWLQLQIVELVLIVFCILYLVVNVIQRIIVAEKGRNNVSDKESQDEFQTIELNSQEFTNNY